MVITVIHFPNLRANEGGWPSLVNKHIYAQSQLVSDIAMDRQLELIPGAEGQKLGLASVELQ